MDKNIEIEIRGPLSKDEFFVLNEFLMKEGKKKSDKDRVLIDYSTFLEGGVSERKKDIRLRVTNGIPEIIVKVGEWGGVEQRKELSVLTNAGNFDSLVQIFGELGYEKGMLCVRKSMVYDYRGIEFALVEVPGHSYYYEAEKMAADGEDGDMLVEELQNTCKELKLNIFDKQGFFDYIEKLNIEANEVFDYKNYTFNYFKDRFNLK